MNGLTFMNTLFNDCRVCISRLTIVGGILLHNFVWFDVIGRFSIVYNALECASVMDIHLTSLMQ